MGQLIVGREEAYNEFWEELADQEAEGCDTDTPFCCQLRHVDYAMELSGAEIVSCDRLHSLVESHDDHDEEEYDTVHDAVGSDRHVATVFFQSPVDQQDDKARAEVHQERRHPDRDDCVYQFFM